MHICYVDESGTPDQNDNENTNHFVLAGIALPVSKWRDADEEISLIKKDYDLTDASEIHTGWLLRIYHGQRGIPDFEDLDYEQRKKEVRKVRDRKLFGLRSDGKKARKYKKDFDKIEPYIHLTYQERREFLEKIAVAVAKWDFARLFADCIDKNHFEPGRAGGRSIGEEAFDQVISRFDTCLKSKSLHKSKEYGIIVHDNSPGIADERMQMMRGFFNEGTRHLDNIEHVIETPLFVDSKLTSMVQIADLCAYALRRYTEKKSDNFLFDKIYNIADRKTDNRLVGIRHFTVSSCNCKLCTD